MNSRLSWAGITVIALLALAGCTATKYQGTLDAQAGPTFTEEEKENMTDKEKLEIYNAQLREQDQLICRRQVVTGSHRKRMVCMTRKEKEIAEDAARRTLERSDGLTGAPTADF